MPYHVVQQGETLGSIAHRCGVTPESVWDASENAELRELRGEGNILRPGDVLFVEEGEPPLIESLDVGGSNRFKAQIPMHWINLNFDHNGEPVANESYELVAEGQRLEGTSDGQGRVRLSLRVTSRRARLTFPGRRLSYQLDVGGLDPIEEMTGVQTRLRQLGFFGGEIDGRESRELTQSLLRFQQMHGLTESGQADAETRARLQEEHGA